MPKGELVKKLECFVIYTYDKTDVVSRSIAECIGANVSHVILGFRNLHGMPNPVCFESTLRDDKNTGHDGLRGPFDMSEVCSWANADPQHRIMREQLIHLTRKQILATYRYLSSRVGQIRYAFLDLALIYLAIRTPLCIGPRHSTRTAWQCAEAIARAMPPEFQVEYCGVGDVTYDFVIPAGNVLPSIENAVTRWNQKY